MEVVVDLKKNMDKIYNNKYKREEGTNKRKVEEHKNH